MKNASVKTLNSFKQSLPVILGVLFLLSLIMSIIPDTLYVKIFSGNKLIDLLLGAVLGSVSGGSPMTSYILAGEFLDQGVSVLAATAFMLAWVTVGLIQLPAESLMLGKKFAIVRNILSFVTVIIVAILTILTLSLI